MRVNWSKRAIADLNGIATYIEQDDPVSAENVATKVFDQVMSLSSMEERSKIGRVPGTREMFILPWPYFVVYRVLPDEVRVMRVRHTAQRWPVRS